MRKMWSKSSKRHSVSAASKLGNSEDSRSLMEVTELDTSADHVRNLIDPDYDATTVKHAWVNGILNVSSTNDFNESSLRLYRMELRGCHLYVYRAPASMNVRRFKPDSNTQDSVVQPGPDLELTSMGYSAQSTGSITKVESSSMSESIIATSSSTVGSTNDLPFAYSFAGQGIAAKKSTESPSSIADKEVVFTDHISYFSHKVPHPELELDSVSSTFNSESSLEALVHFFMFANDSTHAKLLDQLTIVFPLIPKFGDVLRLVYVFLRAIQCGQFSGNTSIVSSRERVLHLIKHIDENFSGFLLKSDVAPFIPKIFQCLSSESQESQLTSITKLQKSIITHQSKLLSLINNVDSKAVHSHSDMILDEFNSTRFMQKISLSDLVAVVSEIDRSFFTSWNSSLDKSLLLHTLACDKNHKDSFYKKNSLVFDNAWHLHYLSRLFSHHLFVENEKSGPEYQARIIERWIDFGCLLDKSGNMSSWLGVASVILSQPVLRLCSIWSYVGDEYIHLLKNDWSPVLFQLDQRYLANFSQISVEGGAMNSSQSLDDTSWKHSFHIMAPRGMGKIYPSEQAIPYFGDLLIDNTKCSKFADLENIWKKVTYSLDRWNEYLQHLSDFKEIISYNQSVIEYYETNGMALSNETLNQVLHLGVNKDGSKFESSLPKPSNHVSTSTPHRNAHLRKSELRDMLFRLLEFNSDSFDLNDLMQLSLKLEPIIIESHVKRASSETMAHGSSKEAADSTNASVVGVPALIHDPDADTTNFTITSKSEVSEVSTFNLEYYKIDFLKFDDLLSSISQETAGVNHTRDIVVDDQLVLRLDDFMSDSENCVARIYSLDQFDRVGTDDEGLGIDVDDILTPFRHDRSHSISESHEKEDVNSTNKRARNSHFSSESSHLATHPITQRYIPRFATMDKLIDLLLIDSTQFDASHPIDSKEFMIVFMLNYSSFITTKELLEHLVFRFIHSGNAVISVMQKQYLQKQGIFDSSTFAPYPRWSSDKNVDLSPLGDVDYKLLLQIQSNILKILLIILTDFPESFHNDLANKSIMIKILKLYSNEILQWYNSHKISDHLLEPFELLVESYKQVKRAFIRKTYRPAEQSRFERFLLHDFKLSRSMREVPINRNLPSHSNIHKVEKFLIKFNKLLAIFYQGITPKDWFVVFKVLEDQFINHSLFYYDAQNQSTPENMMKISDVFSYLESLRGSDGNSNILSRFPLVFQKLYHVYFKFKAYLLIQLCDENINQEERLERMKTLLVMVQISRLKMGDCQFDFSGDEDEIPSCIETALVSVIYSPESRFFEDSWIKASAAFNEESLNMEYIDGIETLLPRHITHDKLLAGHEPLLPCFGWIIQNLIQLVEYPSFHRSAINFNKRYILFKLIKAVNVEEFKNDDLHKDTREFEFLLNLDETQAGHYDSTAMFTRKQTTALFSKALRRQDAINTSQNSKRPPRGTPRPSGSDNKHVPDSSFDSTAKRQSITYKTNSSSRFKISGLFTKSRSFGHPTAQERAVTYKELPDPINAADVRQKPLLTISLKDKKIFPVYLLPYCFKLDTNNASETHFFQAANEDDSRDWLRCLSFANRHWFLSKSTNTKGDHTYTTFGVPLAMVCARDATDCPIVLNRIYEAIEKDSLEEVGIYRISTSLSELSWIKQEINKTGTIYLTDRNIDVHTLTSCVKSFFRELPDALLTDPVIELLYPSKRFTNDTSKFTSGDTNLYQKALACLPAANYYTLKALVRHLSVVVEKNHANKMTCSNLATVIGPALTEASNLESLITNIGAMNHVLEKLIENYLVIFESDNGSIGKKAN